MKIIPLLLLVIFSRNIKAGGNRDECINYILSLKNQAAKLNTLVMAAEAELDPFYNKNLKKLIRITDELKSIKSALEMNDSKSNTAQNYTDYRIKAQ